ncbi:hypothetical protein OS670_13310 [Pseudomonadaceae bacterium T75]|nr:hypothetical protein OS670_13310 [Pseudomonadaceae bacterium T75]
MPTFRETLSGLWACFDPAELATPEAFRRYPALVGGWYEWRSCGRSPTRHLLQSQMVPKLTVITQDADDLHERAGSTDVIHSHGNIQTPRCFACGRGHDIAEHSKDNEVELRIEPPRCRRPTRSSLSDTERLQVESIEAASTCLASVQRLAERRR